MHALLVSLIQRIGAFVMGSEDKNKGKAEEKKLQKVVGKRFRHLREENGLSQEQMAEEIGISARQVYNYENGTSRIPDTTKIQIKKQFRISIDELLMGEEAQIDYRDEAEVKKMSNIWLAKYSDLFNSEIIRRLKEQ